MFARNVTYSIKPNMDREMVTKFEKEVLPILRKTHGFQDQITLSRDKNELVSISMWDKREQLEAYVKDTDAQVVKILSPLYNGNPDVRNYEVTNFTSHKVTAS
jgi:heme-degrading monooxygenase HmoA